MARIYKEDTPNNTIFNIRKILANIDLFVYESYWGAPYKNTFSVRIQSDEYGGDFGTNGKGRTLQYALASAYAEFAERLQNGFLAGANSFNRKFLNKIKETSGYVFFPDEKTMTRSQFDEMSDAIKEDIFKYKLSKEEVTEYFERAAKNGYDGIISIPFYNVRAKRIDYIPYNLLLMHVGSNGMAAGNSIYEASFQSLCELCERYASSQIFTKQLTPPTISRDYLIENCPTEYEMIAEIEASKQFIVTVKDFSAGLRLPSIGVIIETRDGTMYKLNIGSDTSLPVALGRALTEIYQGYKNEEEFLSRMLDKPKEERAIFVNNDSYSLKERDVQLSKFTKDGSGYFPISLFGMNPSYNFDPTIFTPGETYKEDAQKLVRYFLDNGMDVYMRNTSFLGFPSVLIYIPFVSGLGRKNVKIYNGKMLETYVEADKVEDLFFPGNALTEEKISQLIKYLDPIEEGVLSPDTRMHEVLKLSFKSKAPWQSVPISFFLIGFYYTLHQYEKALESLEVYVRDNHLQDNDYYSDLASFIRGKISDEPNKKISEELKNKFEKEMADISSIFGDIKLPNCPNCESCKLIDDCLTRHLYSKTIEVNAEMKNHDINQKNSFHDFS